MMKMLGVTRGGPALVSLKLLSVIRLPNPIHAVAAGLRPRNHMVVEMYDSGDRELEVATALLLRLPCLARPVTNS